MQHLLVPREIKSSRWSFGPLLLTNEINTKFSSIIMQLKKANMGSNGSNILTQSYSKFFEEMGHQGTNVVFIMLTSAGS